MKKFFYFFATAMVMCAAVSMTSCSKDDDKDDPIIEEPEQVVEQVIYYKASVTKDLLTYYDVKLVLSNDEKTKEVTLTTENCKTFLFLNTVELLEYTVKEIDGVRGVYNVKATVTPKDHIERMFAETKNDVCFGADGYLLEAAYLPETDEWGLNAYESQLHCSAYYFDPKGFLDLIDGRPYYDRMAEVMALNLEK